MFKLKYVLLVGEFGTVLAKGLFKLEHWVLTELLFGELGTVRAAGLGVNEGLSHKSILRTGEVTGVRMIYILEPAFENKILFFLRGFKFSKAA